MTPKSPPAKRKLVVVEYLNVYPREFSAGHPSLAAARELCHPEKLAVVKLTFEKDPRRVTAEIVS